MASADVVKVAMPLLSVPVPIGLPPSRNVTVPVAVPDPGATGDTVAVNVTDWPKTEGFAEEATAVVESDLTTVTEATEVLPVPPSVELIVTLLVCTPRIVP